MFKNTSNTLFWVFRNTLGLAALFLPPAHTCPWCSGSLGVRCYIERAFKASEAVFIILEREEVGGETWITVPRTRPDLGPARKLWRRDRGVARPGPQRAPPRRRQCGCADVAGGSVTADRPPFCRVSFHLDHCGALPWFLQKTSFKGRTFMTHATKAIYRWLLSDYVKVRCVARVGLCHPWSSSHGPFALRNKPLFFCPHRRR